MADKETIDRIAIVDEVHAITMSNNPTTFSWQSLPFYRNFRLLRAIVTLPQRPLEFHYADDGTRVRFLGVLPERVYEVNEYEGLQLDAAQIPAYVRFFFDNASSNWERTAVVEHPEEVLWLRKADGEAAKEIKAQAVSLIHPMAVSAGSPETFDVHATAVRNTHLLEIDLLVNANGHLHIQEEHILVENLPVSQIFPF